jgi:hypothetical protein
MHVRRTAKGVSKMDLHRIEISLKDDSDRIIMKKKLTGLPLREEVVLKWSMEWFNDPEPCMIHRTAVMKRLFMEWAEYLEPAMASGKCEMPWTQVPDHLRQMLHTTGAIHCLMVEERK